LPFVRLEVHCGAIWLSVWQCAQFTTVEKKIRQQLVHSALLSMLTRICELNDFYRCHQSQRLVNLRSRPSRVTPCEPAVELVQYAGSPHLECCHLFVLFCKYDSNTIFGRSSCTPLGPAATLQRLLMFLHIPGVTHLYLHPAGQQRFIVSRRRPRCRLGLVNGLSLEAGTRMTNLLRKIFGVIYESS
jgi:hypothetical protein